MSQQHATTDHVTPYDRFAWSDVEMEHLLVTGQYEAELAAYFGAREYQELAALARQAAAVPLHGTATRVFVVPGIMGSQLGLKRQAPLPNDILWLDPIDIGTGRLSILKLSAGAPIVPLGVVLFSYLRLKLHLRASGFAPVLYDYDWRLGVEQLGMSLAERIRNDPAPRKMIVAHSMGGLVSRAALAQPDMSHLERAILLGTPNFGSFAPLMALRGTYSVVRKVASLAGSGTPESLAADIFNSFPSLYQMLPWGRCNDGADLFDATQWPRSGPAPTTALLSEARSIGERLAGADERLISIVGVGQETVTSVTRLDDDFQYTVTRHGDGTVPAVSAALPGSSIYYTRANHSDLTRDATVAAAVTELLASGVTRRLPDRCRSRSAAQARITDQQLRRMHTAKVDWAALQPAQRREFLENLNEPPKLQLRIPAASRAGARATPGSAS